MHLHIHAGNILINMLMKKWYNKEFDKGGQIVSRPCTLTIERFKLYYHGIFVFLFGWSIVTLLHSLSSQALSGNVSKDLLNQMLKDDYIYKTPPKSTGREVRITLCKVYRFD